MKFSAWITAALGLSVMTVAVSCAELDLEEDESDEADRIKKVQREEFLQSLTVQERAAWQQNRWDLLDARLERLRARDKRGTLTPEGKADLERLENFKRQHTKLVLTPLKVTSEATRPNAPAKAPLRVPPRPGRQ